MTTSSEGLFFYSDGTDNSEYLLSSNHEQITGQISRVVSTVSVGESHGLSNGDFVKLKVVPNSVVGLGSTSPLSIKFNEDQKKILINTVGIDSSQINIVDNTITIANHGYKTEIRYFTKVMR